MNVDLPTTFYRACYVASAVLFLVPELLALLDRDRGDTLTENLRPAIQASSLLAFIVVAVAFWLIYHFLIEGR